MSTIKPIEGRSVHQIQSGQVIVDLNSVVKELVENSLDAGATSIDIRFKNQGLESIEVQDNGAGIAPEDYATVALKHHTSKLSSYDDLSSLDTFGFRGEALSSLCALSHFHILTARESEAPKGKKLDFEILGNLKGTTVAACPKGTTVAVETLFYNLPVRRRELEKNIKREYGKVLGILHAYACISTSVRFSVSNQVAKGKKVVVFSTNSNPDTRQNISNVFGAKTLLALIPMSLDLELQPTTSQTTQTDASSHQAHLDGHISRPVFGEGRQTPDRQMFFVNSRPCALPQVAKAFNEVYKSYNITQSPFIFANLKLNTNSYDVNVSPDKRTILLHDQTALLETLKESLNQLFEAQDQTVPQSQLPSHNLPSFQPLTVNRESLASPTENDTLEHNNIAREQTSEEPSPSLNLRQFSSSSSLPQHGEELNLVQKFAARNLRDRESYKATVDEGDKHHPPRKGWVEEFKTQQRPPSPELRTHFSSSQEADDSEKPRPVQDFNDRLASQQIKESAGPGKSSEANLEIPTIAVGSSDLSGSFVQSAFDRMRPKRTTQDEATVLVGSNVNAAVLGTPIGKRRKIEATASQTPSARPQFSSFAKRVHVYAAPGTQSDVGTQAFDDGSDTGSQQDNDEEIEDELQQPQHFSASAHESLVEPEGSNADESSQAASEDDSDAEFIDETERKKRDEAKVEEMVRRAEEAAARPTREQKKRAATLLRSRSQKSSTLSLVHELETSVQRIDDQLAALTNAMNAFSEQTNQSDARETQDSSKVSAEERLALTIIKSDFAEMRIIGQFNLGFILATRQAKGKSSAEDLFIIDQHASDEIYNFSRLSLTTTLNPQRLVRPHPLELTAIEEETILNHADSFAKNGFNISVDESGDSPVGRRCYLLTLPTSRETVFDTRDLEELIALLGDTTPAARGQVVRPSKVRKMLAMRACRSSIMVGKPLTKRGMATVVRHMGDIDRPWNCPHGRPTMRHLAGLGDWRSWEEGDGLVEDEDGGAAAGGNRDETDWWTYLQRAGEVGHSAHESEADENPATGVDHVVGEDGNEDASDRREGDDDDDDGQDDDNDEDGEDDDVETEPMEEGE